MLLAERKRDGLAKAGGGDRRLSINQRFNLLKQLPGLGGFDQVAVDHLLGV